MRKLVVLPAAALVLTACGSSQPAADPAETYKQTPVATIISDARTAMHGLTSVHLVASVKDPSDGEMKLDFHSSTGQQCVGDLTSEGLTVKILRSEDGKVFMNGGQEFWTKVANATAAQLFAGKWITGMTDAQAEKMTGFCDLKGMTDTFFKDDMKSTKAKVLGTGKVGGVSSVQVQVTDSDGKVGTLNVAASAPHYVLSMDAPGEASFTFDHFNDQVDAKAPTDAVNASDLKK